MGKFLGGLLFFLSFSAFAQKVTLTELTSLYTVPGFDASRCAPRFRAEYGCTIDKSIAWPDENSKVRFINGKDGQPMTFTMVGKPPGSQSVAEETWYKVEVEYTRDGTHKKEIGWIKEDYISVESPPVKVCESPSPQRQEKRNKSTAQTVLDAVEQGPVKKHREKVAEVAAAISPFVGTCVLDEGRDRDPKNWDLSRPVYDQRVLPVINQQRSNLPMFSAMTGKQLTMDKLIEIDMLARTIYGEMAKCHKGGRGVHQLKAVAKVVFNRAYYHEQYKKDKGGRDSEFVEEAPWAKLDHRADETAMMSVMTSSRKFNPWDLSLKKKEWEYNEGVSHALCPPASSKRYWGTDQFGNAKSPVPPHELKIWRDTLEIATEAVLFPKEFEAGTSEVQEMFFKTRTSAKEKMTRFNRHTRVDRKIDGKWVKNDYCAVLYKASPVEEERLKRAKGLSKK